MRKTSKGESILLKSSSPDFPVLALAYKWVRGYFTRKAVSLYVFNQNMEH